MKSIASEVRKARSRSTSGLLATTAGGTAQHPLLSEILAEDKRDGKQPSR